MTTQVVSRCNPWDETDRFILQHVIALLPPEDLWFVVSLVCKQWRAHSRDPALLRHAFERYYGYTVELFDPTLFNNVSFMSHLFARCRIRLLLQMGLIGAELEFGILPSLKQSRELVERVKLGCKLDNWLKRRVTIRIVSAEWASWVHACHPYAARMQLKVSLVNPVDKKVYREVTFDSLDPTWLHLKQTLQWLDDGQVFVKKLLPDNLEDMSVVSLYCFKDMLHVRGGLYLTAALPELSTLVSLGKFSNICHHTCTDVSCNRPLPCSDLDRFLSIAILQAHRPVANQHFFEHWDHVVGTLKSRLDHKCRKHPAGSHAKKPLHVRVIEEEKTNNKKTPK